MTLGQLLSDANWPRKKLLAESSQPLPLATPLRIVPDSGSFLSSRPEKLWASAAIGLASELPRKKTPPAGLILRSTFRSLADAGAYHFPWLPVRWLLIDRFPSVQCIRDVTCPLLQFHGRRDTIIPLRLGKQLFAAAPEKSASEVAKQFVELPNADHNDVLETSGTDVSKAVRKFLPVVVPR